MKSARSVKPTVPVGRPGLAYQEGPATSKARYGTVLRGHNNGTLTGPSGIMKEVLERMGLAAIAPMRDALKVAAFFRS